MSNGSSKDKLVLYNPVTLKFWACRNWQFRKMQKKKKKKKKLWIEDEQNFTNYYTLAPLSQSLTRKWVEQENWKWSKHDVEAVKQQTDCTHHARSWSTELAGRNSQLANEMGFFQRVLFKNHLLRAYCLGFDWSGWIVLIKSEILITTGMVWPVSSGKWKVPFSQHIVHALPRTAPRLKVGGQSQQKRRPGRKNKLPKSFWPVKAEANALAWSCCPNERWPNTRGAPLRWAVSGNSPRRHTAAYRRSQERPQSAADKHPGLGNRSVWPHIWEKGCEPRA